MRSFPSGAACLCGNWCPRMVPPIGSTSFGRSLRACPECRLQIGGDGNDSAAAEDSVVDPSHIFLTDPEGSGGRFPEQVDLLLRNYQMHLTHTLDKLSSKLIAAHRECTADLGSHRDSCDGCSPAAMFQAASLSSSMHSKNHVKPNGASSIDDLLMVEPEPLNRWPTPAFPQTVSQQLEERRQLAIRASRSDISENAKAAEDSFGVSENQSKTHIYKLQKALRRSVQHPMFLFLILLAIYSNALLVGVETNIQAKNPVSSTGAFFQIAEYVYTCIFAVELLIRYCAYGYTHFFCDKEDRGWNMFDVALVSLSIIGLFGASVDSNSVLRALRVTRLIRLIRVVRVVRFIQALRTLIHSVLSALRTLIWALVLLLALFYAFGIAFTDAASEQRQSVTSISEEVNSDLVKWWGDLVTSMFTLFKSVTGGLSWHEAVVPLGQISPFWSLVFCFFVSFTFLAVLNVITASFCQTAVESAQHDQAIATAKILAQRKTYCEKFHDLFQDIDADQNEYVTLGEFEQILASDRFAAYFAALEIDASDAWTLFQLLDIDQNGRIEIDEFVNGCLHLRGQAKAIQFAKIDYENRLTRRMIEQFMSRVDKHFRELRRNTTGTYSTSFP